MSGSTQSRLAGVTSFTIEGSPYDLVSDPKWSVSKVKREMLINLSGPSGYKETYTAGGFISATVRDTSVVTVGQFNAMTSVTVAMILPNGKVVSGENLVCTEAIEVNAEEGTYEVKFEGQVNEN